MQILTIRKGWEAFESNFEPFERDSKLSNPNSNPSNEIGSIRIQIWTIQKDRSIWMQILTTRKGFEAFESQFEPLDRAFECKFETF